MKKRILALLLALCMVIGMLPAAAMAANTFTASNSWSDGLFTDVKQGDWFYENVKSAYELGLMLGCGDGTFEPVGAEDSGPDMGGMGPDGGLPELDGDLPPIGG